MADQQGLSMPAAIVLRFIANIGLVLLLHKHFGDFFAITDSVHAWVVVAALITLMNIVIRPVLNVITFPLKLFATILAIIIVNGVFVQITVSVVENMDPEVVTLTINGGLWGWTVVAIVMGLGNWVMKIVIK